MIDPARARELDDSLFVLPLPDEAAGRLDLPEPPALRQGADSSRRAKVKRGFWRQIVAPLTFRPVFSHEFKARDPIPPERMKQLEGWATMREPRIIEQPWKVEEALLERCPQFILRNLMRYEKDAWPEYLPWTFSTLRDEPSDMGLDDIHRLRLYEAYEYEERWSLGRLADNDADRTELFRDTPWSRLAFRGGRAYDYEAKARKEANSDEAYEAAKARARLRTEGKMSWW